MVAIGLYLRRLREVKYSNRDLAAKKLRVDKSQVERLENGTHNVGSSFFLAFIKEMGGDPKHVLTLYDNPVADAIAEALAEDQIEILRQGKQERDERYSDVDDIIAQLIDHPRAFDIWIGYGRRLIDEQRDSP